MVTSGHQVSFTKYIPRQSGHPSYPCLDGNVNKAGHPHIMQNTHAFSYKEVLSVWHAMCESGWGCVRCLTQCVKNEQRLVTHWCLTLNVWEWMCLHDICHANTKLFYTPWQWIQILEIKVYNIHSYSVLYIHVHCILYVYIGFCITCACLCAPIHHIFNCIP